MLGERAAISSLPSPARVMRIVVPSSGPAFLALQSADLHSAVVGGASSNNHPYACRVRSSMPPLLRVPFCRSPPPISQALFFPCLRHTTSTSSYPQRSSVCSVHYIINTYQAYSAESLLLPAVRSNAPVGLFLCGCLQ
uniref:Uncharacterized protein n=1 Tax=Setaria viridis TaxID=4556 RepID=A0A4U6V0A9_SETVI|nr:hypothetical protein SEVIR_4G223104v2 [Setaria viridis]